MSKPLPDQAAEYADERTAVASDKLPLQRAYMAGALAALTSKAPREQLLRECIDYGRTVGSALEVAR